MPAQDDLACRVLYNLFFQLPAKAQRSSPINISHYVELFVTTALRLKASSQTTQ